MKKEKRGEKGGDGSREGIGEKDGEKKKGYCFVAQILEVTFY